MLAGAPRGPVKKMPAGSGQSWSGRIRSKCCAFLKGGCETSTIRKCAIAKNRKAPCFSASSFGLCRNLDALCGRAGFPFRRLPPDFFAVGIHPWSAFAVATTGRDPQGNPYPGAWRRHLGRCSQASDFAAFSPIPGCVSESGPVFLSAGLCAMDAPRPALGTTDADSLKKEFFNLSD